MCPFVSTSPRSPIPGNAGSREATALFHSTIAGHTVRSAQKQGMSFSYAASAIFIDIDIVFAIGFRAIAR